MDNISTSLLVLVVIFILAAWIGGFYRHVQIAEPEGSSNTLLHYALILLIADGEGGGCYYGETDWDADDEED